MPENWKAANIILNGEGTYGIAGELFLTSIPSKLVETVEQSLSILAPL